MPSVNSRGPRGPLSYRGRGLQGADRDHAQTLCEIEKPERLLSTARRTSGQRASAANGALRSFEGREIEFVDKSSLAEEKSEEIGEIRYFCTEEFSSSRFSSSIEKCKFL